MALTASSLSSETPVAITGVEVLPDRSRRAPVASLIREPAEPTKQVPSAEVIAAALNRLGAIEASQQNAAAILAKQTQQLQNQSRINTQVLAVSIALTRVLAVRFLLFLTLIGGFVLALQAMQRETIPAIAVMVAYALLIIGPLVALEVRHGRVQQMPQAG